MRQYTKWKTGMALKLARVANGMTQTQLARSIDTTCSSISRYENGESSMSVETASRAADVLGISVDQLTGRIEGKKGGETWE